jgi:hypothetical protein
MFRRSKSFTSIVADSNNEFLFSWYLFVNTQCFNSLPSYIISFTQLLYLSSSSVNTNPKKPFFLLNRLSLLFNFLLHFSYSSLLSISRFFDTYLLCSLGDEGQTYFVLLVSFKKVKVNIICPVLEVEIV